MKASMSIKSDICQIIGVLDNGLDSLSPFAFTAIKNADVIIGGARTLALFNKAFKNNAEQKDLTGKLSKVPEWINTAQQNKQSVTVLATGDPLCHGIANFLQNKLGKEKFNVIPNTSTIQLACAKLGIAWQSAHILSIHTKDAGEWDQHSDNTHGLYPLLQASTQHELLVLFTSSENSPARIARMLQQEGLSELFTISVAANLLTSNEKIYSNLAIDTAATQTFDDPNIVVLQRKIKLKGNVLFGMDDASFAQRKPDKGLITKREVRAVSLARMQLKENSIVWDIGAGSGSVGLEAAQICTAGYIFAIEKNKADSDIVQQNKIRLGICNYKLFNARAPEYLNKWPRPDAIFIGGSGGKLDALIKFCLEQLNEGGCLVMNFVTLENLNVATETLKQLDATWDVTQLQASRSKPILHMHRMQAENPVWIVCAQAAIEKKHE